MNLVVYLINYYIVVVWVQAALELDLASLDKRVSAADWDGRMISEIKAIRKYRYWRVLTGQTYEGKTKGAGAALIMFFFNSNYIY